MRGILVLLCMHCVRACLPGFVGLSCNVCPTDYVCDSGTPVACVNGSRAQLGSRACDIAPNPVLATEVRRLPPKRWTTAVAKIPDAAAACGCFLMSRDLSVVLDAGSRILIGGVALKGASGSWVSRFQVSHGSDGVTWRPIGGVYGGNADEMTVVERRFPYVVQARFLKISVVDYFRWPSMQAAFLEATNTTCSACFDNATVEAPYVKVTTAVNITPANACPRFVNMVVVNASTCAYSCRRSTFGPSCVPRPRPSRSAPGGVRFFLSRRRLPHIESRLHSFPGGVYAMEFKTWNGSDLAVQIDALPFMAWNMKPWRSDFGNRSQWLLLPSQVATRVRVRVLWNRSFVVQFEATVATTHGMQAATYTRSSLATSALWGLGNAVGNADSLGDSQSVCSVTTNRPAVLQGSWFQAFSTLNDAHSWGRQAVARAPSVAPASLFETVAACENVSHAVQRLCLYTELSGVSAHFSGFVGRRCSQNATIFVPAVSRTQVWHVALVFLYREDG